MNEIDIRTRKHGNEYERIQYDKQKNINRYFINLPVAAAASAPSSLTSINAL